MPSHRTCETCGSSFTTYPSEIARGRGRFCSRTCSDKRRDTTPKENSDSTYSIPLTKGYTALIDAVDLHIVQNHRWSVAEDRTGSSLRYAVTYINGKRTKMHELLLPAPKGMERDHINGDGLDNRRSNLRLCTRAQNLQNRRMFSSNTTGFKGVCRHRGSFIARITANGKTTHLGRFDSAAEAGAAYSAAADQIHGQFARQDNLEK